MKHPWMTSSDISEIDILETVRENFNPRRTLKSAVGAIRAMNRLKTASEKTGGDQKAVSVFAKAIAQNKKEKEQGKGRVAATTAEKENGKPAATVAASAFAKAIAQNKKEKEQAATTTADKENDAPTVAVAAV